jgi:hypothetical protein
MDPHPLISKPVIATNTTKGREYMITSSSIKKLDLEKSCGGNF